MRILHVLPSLSQEYGGPLRAVLDLSARSSDLGLDSEVLGFGRLNIPDNPLPEARIHSLPISHPKSYCYSPKLRGWIRSNLGRFDGVILHGMWLYPNWLFPRECRAAGVPFVCFPHGMLEPWSVFGQGLFKRIKKSIYWAFREKSVFQGATAVFFTTHREKNLATKTFSLPLNSYIVVPYGIDVSRGAGAEVEDPKIADISPNIALFLGRIHPKKNPELLIEAWAEASPPPEWKLVIAGPGQPSYIEHLRKIVRQRGIESSVVFQGFVSGDAKAALFRKAKWFLLPSRQENFGIAVLEAISFGCPVAISDSVYLSDYFHGESEVLPLSLAAWVGFMRDRMPDEERRRAVIALDQKELVPRFAFGTISAAWVETITSVFSKSAAGEGNSPAVQRLEVGR